MSAAAADAGAADAAAAFPWDEAMAVAFGVLRLCPSEFWRMTPRELGFALAPFRARFAEPLRRGALDDLMQRFPDGR